jgi:signal peptidase I
MSITPMPPSLGPDADEHPAESLPTVVWAASIVAFLLVGLAVLAALTGRVAGLITAPVFLIGGIGILRRRVWSAYGLAMFQAAQLLSLLVVLSRGASPFAGTKMFAGAILAVAVLFFVSGRRLVAVGGKKGHVVPWTVLTGLTAIPAVLFVFLLPFAISTAAMENTLLVGDMILVRRPGPAVKRGDIIVFRYPMDIKQTFVKRAVGIPGDRIKVVDKQLYVNGVRLNEPYVYHMTDYIDSYRDNFPGEPNVHLYPPAQKMLEQNVRNGEVIVPDGFYFAMGDNRDSSLDSRYWGFVREEDVIGKPVMIYWSYERKSDLSGRQSEARIRWGRLFKPI